MVTTEHPKQVSISPLLSQLANPTTTLQSIPASEIAAAVSLIFTDSISAVQAGCLLYALHTTQLDRRPDVLAACAASMREAAAQVDVAALNYVVHQRSKREGAYHGGLVRISLSPPQAPSRAAHSAHPLTHLSQCDIVGTGGDSHNTYNVSTTSSILASALLLIAKHGNNASTSKSGSADLLLAYPSTPPVIAATTAETLPKIYEHSAYAFLYAREWHPGMRHAAAVRKELPFRTVFNLLGPLANPVAQSGALEARIVGVAKKDMGPVFADALRLSGARKAMVVCGEEDMDEISCAGRSFCWLLREREGAHGGRIAGPEGVEVVPFVVAPEDLGLQRHPLVEVAGGKSPVQNAGILQTLLEGGLEEGDPILDFVLMNTAALLVLSGICDADESAMGEGDDGKVITERGPGGMRWKEGVRRARWCIKSGGAMREWQNFIRITNEIGEKEA